MTELFAIISLKDGRRSKDTENADELKSNCSVSFLCQWPQNAKLDTMVLVVQDIVELSIMHTLEINQVNLSTYVHASSQDGLMAGAWFFPWMRSNANETEHREHLTDPSRDAFSVLCADPLVKSP